MALTKDSPRHYSVIGVENVLPVQASSTVYAGSALSFDTGGEVGPLSASEAGFAGFGMSKSDNSSGSAGDIGARVLTEGEIELVIAGLDDNNDLNDLVYATDDDTFTLTASGGVPIGRVSQIVSLSANKARVKFSSLSNEHPND
ncbi:MAG: hypothetical protein AAGC72_15035 [Planctomycetota bacterium]